MPTCLPQFAYLGPQRRVERRRPATRGKHQRRTRFSQSSSVLPDTKTIFQGVIDRRQSEEASRLRRIRAAFGNPTQIGRRVIPSKCSRRPHAERPSTPHGES
jgi:hypothetical protein